MDSSRLSIPVPGQYVLASGLPNKLWPLPAKNPNIFNFALAGVGTMSPTIGTRFAPANPPQQGQMPLLTHPVATVPHSHDCPTCQLEEIPYSRNLPRLDGTY